MQVRVFEAPDMATGLRMVKKELGPDALILSTRTVRSGKLGLIGKPILEITAAIDTDYAADAKMQPQGTSPAPHSAVSKSQNSATPRMDGNHQKNAKGFYSVLDEPVDQYLGQQPATQGAPSTGTAKTSSISHVPAKEEVARQNNELQSEVNELKDLVKSLAGQISQFSNQSQAQENRRGTGLQVREKTIPKNNLGTIQGDHLLSMLVDRGINVESSRTIASFLRESLTDQELSNENIVNQAIIDSISNLIEIDPPQFQPGGEQSRIALIGPTGVGKTTTLAKIAARHLADHSGKIALITIDTYRIAAVEQLKVYGEIMHLPVEVVITPSQLFDALDRHQDKDLILIDTAGRSPKDHVCIEELNTFFPDDLAIDKHLVLSATTRENELTRAIERFSQLDLTHTIFTKIDECDNLGVLLNIQIQNRCPLSFLTNGQRVPEDLLSITPQVVAELIMDQNTGPLHDEHITSNN